MRQTVIIGGGLAGLITAIQLNRAGIPCSVIEKKSYPFHRVCGEYISNEALPFLKDCGLYPEQLVLPQINTFEFSDINGHSCKIPLDLGGFGISRYAFDNFLYQIAKKEGVDFELNTEVREVTFTSGEFHIKTPSREIISDLVVGSFGKRSRLDVQQNRPFIRMRSPYVGVKYHIRSHHPDHLISLHNFPGGYCGIGNVEEGITNLCYLSHRDNIRQYGDIHEMEKGVLYKNPFLRDVFRSSTFVFTKPEIINEVSFATKRPVENHILMAGDAAGMVTPVCGNGMAIAMHSGKILSECVIQYHNGRINREGLEKSYEKEWRSQFRTRLWYGRQVQRMFGNGAFSKAAVNLGRWLPPLARLIIRQTHGVPF